MIIEALSLMILIILGVAVIAILMVPKKRESVEVCPPPLDLDARHQFEAFQRKWPIGRQIIYMGRAAMIIRNSDRYVAAFGGDPFRQVLTLRFTDMTTLDLEVEELCQVEPPDPRTHDVWIFNKRGIA